MLIDETLTTADIKWSQMDVCTRLSYRKESRFIEMNMPEHVQNFIKQYVRNWVCQAPNVGMFPVWWDKSLLHCQFVRISFNKKLRGTSQTHFISINSSMRLSSTDTLWGTSWCIQVQALNSECYSALNIEGALTGTWCLRGAPH